MDKFLKNFIKSIKMKAKNHLKAKKKTKKMQILRKQ